MSFKIWPGKPIEINGYEISGSNVITNKLIKHDLDSIEGRVSFFLDGHYPHGAECYTCVIAIAITQNGRTGLGIYHVHCWPHDPSRESRRATAAAAHISFIERLKKLLR